MASLTKPAAETTVVSNSEDIPELFKFTGEELKELASLLKELVEMCYHEYLQFLIECGLFDQKHYQKFPTFINVGINGGFKGLYVYGVRADYENMTFCLEPKNDKLVPDDETIVPTFRETDEILIKFYQYVIKSVTKSDVGPSDQVCFSTSDGKIWEVTKRNV